MIKTIDNFGDKYLLLKRTQIRDAFLYRLSHFADHSILWFALAVIRFLIVRDWKDILRFAVVMLVESGLTNGPIKWMFRRARPHEKENTYNKHEKLPYGLRMPITSSFPSGHAVAAMCAATLLSSSYHLAAIFLFPLGILVAYTRLYTRMHHLSDITAGLILGLLFGYLACRFIVF
ncbi:MAG: phosphatase PAP2 family protein [Acidimicrobiia bacterium]